MFRIRRIYDEVLPVNQQAIREVTKIFSEQFSGAPPSDIENLAEKLRNPFKQRFRAVLYVAENSRGHVSGFAIVLHEPVVGFCFLDYIAAGRHVIGRGVGAALYEFVRDEAASSLGVSGIFFECLPDETERCSDPVLRQQNAARMRFYEQYGARPVTGTAFETPLPGNSDDGVPHLMYDDLGSGRPLRAAFAREVVRAILERKYGSLCPPEYVELVLKSFHQDPLPLRPPRYIRQSSDLRLIPSDRRELAALVINDQHDIHHIRERGYVESPVRIAAISGELLKSGMFQTIPARHYPKAPILAVHDADLVDYLQRACSDTPVGKSVYPYVFPIRNATRPPRDLSIRAGYYCIDTFTPINRNAYPAARRGVDCALTAADEILKGRRVAYALIRPPGHHAERRSFGGFCYFNNAAVAANYLCRYGTVAILDIDYHHGNGQQDIFYDRSDVLTISIHGAPEFAYPYFTGFADETGTGAGEGFNINLPLSESLDGVQYRRALQKAIDAVQKFAPRFLVIALGLDPAKGDPTGTWSLSAQDFEKNGQLLAAIDLPTLVIQEGGYRTRTLGRNARSFFQGLIRPAKHKQE